MNDDLAKNIILDDLSCFQEILKALNAHNEISKAFPIIFDCLKTITQCEWVSLTLFNEERTEFVLRAVYPSRVELGDGSRFPVSNSPLLENILNGRSHYTPDLRGESQYPISRLLYQSGYRSRINLPLIGHTAVLGSLNLGWRVTNGLDTSRLPILNQIAAAFAFAIERHFLVEAEQNRLEQTQTQAIHLEAEVNARVGELKTVNEQLEKEVARRIRIEEVLRAYQQELEDRAESLGTLNAIADAAYRSFDVATVVRQSLEAILQNSRFTAVVCFRFDPLTGLLTLIASSGLQGDILPAGTQLTLDNSLSGIAIQRRTVLFTKNLSETEYANTAVNQIFITQGYTRIASVPILYQEKALGAFTVILRNQVDSIDEQKLLLSIGKTIGLAMANAEFVSQIQAEIAEREQTQNALRIYAAELERSNRELQEFTYVASHDLQEPLRKIQTFADRLQEKYKPILDERGNDYLQRMQESANHMSRLIYDLLAFSRLTTAAGPFEEIDLTVIVEVVLDELADTITQANAQINVGFLPTIEAEPTQMRQLFHNLIGNALKFRRKEVPLQVDIWAELLEEQLHADVKHRHLCRIFVRDNGLGFDEKYNHRIFDLFERLHGRDQFDGLGMGLAISRKIAERHLGHIQAQGQPNQGSLFTITLPLWQNR